MFNDPLLDERCKGCAHIDGLICPYPDECNAMKPMNYEKILERLVNDKHLSFKEAMYITRLIEAPTITWNFPTANEDIYFEPTFWVESGY